MRAGSSLARRRLIKSVLETLESRQMLCALHANETVEQAVAAAQARGGADHPLSWYAATATATIETSAPTASRGGVQAEPDANAGGEPVTFQTNAQGLPLLSSNPDNGALPVFLDFDGNGSNLPFSIDADTATFNPDEQKAIYDTFRDQLSYLSMLNVNVTTISPPTGGNNPKFVWHLTSNSISGGYAYVGVLSNSQPWGFNQGSNAVSRRSGIAHELGHLLDLYHQGEYDANGALTSEYSDGLDVRTRPIIGIDYAENVRNWWNGRSSSSADDIQADFSYMSAHVRDALVANNLPGGDGFLADDVGNTNATAKVLDAATQRVRGVIERSSDVDVYKFTSTGGEWNLDATPIFESSVAVNLELFDAQGNLVAAQDDVDLRNGANNDVEFSLNLPAGDYYAKLSSHGDYSNLGEYLFTASPVGADWTSVDLGNVFKPGTFSYDPSTTDYFNYGGGTGVAGTADQARFSYQTLTGDGSITVRLESITGNAAAGRTGIMIRDGLSQTARAYSLTSGLTGGLSFNARNATSGSATAVATASQALGGFLRLTRAGNVITAAYSATGSSFTTLGSSTATSLPSQLQIGLVTTSAAARFTTAGTFDSLAFTGTLGTTPVAVNGLPAPTNVLATPSIYASTNIDLAWSAAAGAAGFVVERSVNNVDFTTLATLASTARAYTDTTSYGGMRFFYRVRATGTGGTVSVPSASATTISKPTAPRVTPTTYTPSVVRPTPDVAYLNWLDSTGETGCRIETTTDGGLSWTTAGTAGKSAIAYNLTGLNTSATYGFRITPLAPQGNGPALLLGSIAAPNVTAFAFQSDTAVQQATIAFSADVYATLAASDFTLTNLTTSATVPTASLALNLAAPGNAATLTFPGFTNGRLPDGKYRLTLAAGTIANGTVATTTATTLDFYVLAGDANADRTVNFSDLVILASNYNTTGRTNATGNFDYSPDTAVNFSDLVLLAANYNKTLNTDGTLTTTAGRSFATDWARAQHTPTLPTTPRTSSLFTTGAPIGSVRSDVLGTDPQRV